MYLQFISIELFSPKIIENINKHTSKSASISLPNSSVCPISGVPGLCHASWHCCLFFYGGPSRLLESLNWVCSQASSPASKHRAEGSGESRFFLQMICSFISMTMYLNQVQVCYFFPSSLSLCIRVSRRYLWRNMKSGSRQTPRRSPFRRMEWKKSTNCAISYLPENAGLGFLPSIFQWTSLSLFSPSTKDV